MVEIKCYILISIESMLAVISWWLFNALFLSNSISKYHKRFFCYKVYQILCFGTFYFLLWNFIRVHSLIILELIWQVLALWIVCLLRLACLFLLLLLCWIQYPTLNIEASKESISGYISLYFLVFWISAMHNTRNRILKVN